jgi:hypothetical protein
MKPEDSFEFSPVRPMPEVRMSILGEHDGRPSVSQQLLDDKQLDKLSSYYNYA